MSGFNKDRCEQSEVTSAYALQALPANEVAAAEAHIVSCPDCRRELESLRPVVDRFVFWPTDVLRPTTALQARLARRIAEGTGKEPMPPPARQWSEPEWEEVDSARKAASAFSIFTALSMLTGAFIACAASALGGQERDVHP
jgi:anti-sigma factor RsiW